MRVEVLLMHSLQWGLTRGLFQLYRIKLAAWLGGSPRIFAHDVDKNGITGGS